MSAETRILPRKQPRSTGIERTTQQVARPGVAGTGGISHVSAAPGAGAAAHAHVLNARNPAATRGGQAGGGAGRKGQDATVAIIDRQTGQVTSGTPGRAGAARTLSAQKPTVEIVDRRQAQGQGQGQMYGAPTPQAGSSPFTIDEINLIGSLLNQYYQRASVVDQTGANTALGVLKTLTELAVNPAPRRRDAPTETPASTPTAPTAIVAEVSVAPIAAPSPTLSHRGPIDADVTGEDGQKET